MICMCSVIYSGQNIGHSHYIFGYSFFFFFNLQVILLKALGCEIVRTPVTTTHHYYTQQQQQQDIIAAHLEKSLPNAFRLTSGDFLKNAVAKVIQNWKLLQSNHQDSAITIGLESYSSIYNNIIISQLTKLFPTRTIIAAHLVSELISNTTVPQQQQPQQNLITISVSLTEAIKEAFKFSSKTGHICGVLTGAALSACQDEKVAQRNSLVLITDGPSNLVTGYTTSRYVVEESYCYFKLFVFSFCFFVIFLFHFSIFFFIHTLLFIHQFG